MTTFKNNGKLKLLIIVGTRPEIIRLAAVINKCRKYFSTKLRQINTDRKKSITNNNSLDYNQMVIHKQTYNQKHHYY